MKLWRGCKHVVLNGYLFIITRKKELSNNTGAPQNPVPRVLPSGVDFYGKKRLREIDRRVRFLTKRLEKAEIVDPACQPRKDQVFFGATVTYGREDGTDVTVTIVGIDETAEGFRTPGDPPRISWVAPVARALLKSRVGDLVTLRTPGGTEEVEVVSIRYPDAHAGP